MEQELDGRANFPQTRWSLVLSAGQEDAGALEAICRLYWPPVYTFGRRSGLGVEDAEDLTQRFFHDLVKGRAHLLAEAGPANGRLRTLILRVLKRRMVDSHRQANREKRGGGLTIIPLDTAGLEAGLSGLSAEASPGAAFDRQWALTVLGLAMARLERDFRAAGREDQYEVLVPFLSLDGGEGSYPGVQEVMKIGPDAARQAVHRFRDRFRRHLRDEIAQTIDSDDEDAIDGELDELREALRQPTGGD